jgi:hypothetical protein
MPQLRFPERPTERLALGLVAAVIGVVLVVMFITACTAQPARLAAPAAALPTAPAASTSPTAVQGDDHGKVDDGVIGVASRTVPFNETFRHDDGLEVKVRVVEHGVVSPDDAKGKVKSGEDFVQLEARVTNRGHHTIKDTFSFWTLTYGPKGEEALQPRLHGLEKHDKGLSGDLKPGDSRVARETFVVPCLCQDEAVLELLLTDDGHRPTVFSGALE